MTDLDRIRELTGKRSQIASDLEQLDLLWREVIGNSVRAGEPAADVAEAAGISRARVYQIRDGRR